MVIPHPAALIPALVPLTLFLLVRQVDHSMHVSRDTWDPEYDYIVVGGGSSGATVASRLSEVPHWKVLLIEAGGSENFLSDVPLAAILMENTPLDWSYKTVPQGVSCFGLEGRQSRWPRGKVLGGSSVLNFMVYMRGNRNDYDRWEAVGNPGWSYQHVLPYFMKMEDNRDPQYAYNGYHGRGGPLTVETQPYPTEITKAFLVAGQQTGYSITDCNGKEQTGFMQPQGTIRRGARCSTAKAYLGGPVRKRENLHVLTFSQVTKLHIDPASKRVQGVSFNRLGMDGYSTRAKREVILTAGSINTPQLLMLSGIGPRDHLKSMGIPCLHHLPGVGSNLQDHIYSGGVHFNLDARISIVQRREVTVLNTLRYVAEGTTHLTSLGGVEGLAFVHTKYSNRSAGWPDVQFHMIGGSPVSDDGAGIRPMMGISDRLWKAVYEPNLPYDAWSIYPTLMRPESRGIIRLKSRDPMEHPLIDPAYLTQPQDIKVMVEAMRLGYALSDTPAFQVWGSRAYPEVWPGCEKYYKSRFKKSKKRSTKTLHPTEYTDDYLACIARTYTATIYHPVGTAKMGPAEDPYAVVDNKLRVYGVKGLRVCDASVMPYIVSGNTNAPTIMIGERCADFIKGVSLPPLPNL